MQGIFFLLVHGRSLFSYYRCHISEQCIKVFSEYSFSPTHPMANVFLLFTLLMCETKPGLSSLIHKGLVKVQVFI